MFETEETPGFGDETGGGDEGQEVPAPTETPEEGGGGESGGDEGGGGEQPAGA
jgi:hypothetical protein